MIDLSFYRRKEFTQARLTYSEINERLLHECAYYPLPAAFGSKSTKCLSCSFETPNPKCKYSHLLTLTNETVTKERGTSKVTSFRVRKEIKKLRDEEVKELIEFVRERRKRDESRNSQ